MPDTLKHKILELARQEEAGVLVVTHKHLESIADEVGKLEDELKIFRKAYHSHR